MTLIELTDAQLAALDTAAQLRWLTGLQLHTASQSERPALELTRTWLSAEMLNVLRWAAENQKAKGE